MTINEVIEKLKAAKPDGRVYFSPLRCVPTTVDSWRGIYAEPALGWQPSGKSGNVKDYPTAASLLAELQKATDGREYTGWKGGEYSYTGNSPLHIDNPGDNTQTEIKEIKNTEWETIIYLTCDEES